MSPRRSHARRHPRNAWRYRLVGIALVLSAGALVTAQAASNTVERSNVEHIRLPGPPPPSTTTTATPESSSVSSSVPTSDPVPSDPLPSDPLPSDPLPSEPASSTTG